MLIGLIFTGVGMVLLGIGALIYHNIQRFISKASRAPGIVVDLHRRTDSQGDHTYAPVVEFPLPSGERIRFTSSISSQPAAYKVSELVIVFYDPLQPTKARIKGTSMWLGVFIVAGLGGIFLIVGLAMLYSVNTAQPI